MKGNNEKNNESSRKEVKIIINKKMGPKPRVALGLAPDQVDASFTPLARVSWA